MKVAIKSKGDCGPSGHDADNWPRVLVFKSFSSCSLDIQKSFANFFKKLCIKNIHASDNVIESRLEAFMANWLIPLNKNPELRPKGVSIVSDSRGNSNARSKEICSASRRWLQVCAGQDVIAEAAIHAMYDLYQQDEFEGVHLVNAENAFCQ